MDGQWPIAPIKIRIEGELRTIWPIDLRIQQLKDNIAKNEVLLSRLRAASCLRKD